MKELILEQIACPLCGNDKYIPFAEENGFKAVRCTNCRIIYVNPRPALSLISEGVKTGIHNEVEGSLNVVGRRHFWVINFYKKILREMFKDVRQNAEPISWLDIGAGFGEFVEALGAVAPKDSKILGIEPMQPKAIAAQKRGLDIKNILLSDVTERYDVVSLINVFSHIPDIKSFLNEIKRVLKPNGNFFLETGNIADLQSVTEIPNLLNLPDHLIFAGEKQIELWLSAAGFEILSIKRLRNDSLFHFFINLIRKILGRKVIITIPYTTSYRSLLIRARLL